MGTPRVLMVDDQPDVRRVLQIALERMGCQVLVASDGESALATALHDRPDLMVLDMRLPGLDGLQVVRRLRKKRRGRNIPVIALTGYSHAQNERSALDCGCDAFFAKPLQLDAFRSKVAELLRVDLDPTGTLPARD